MWRHASVHAACALLSAVLASSAYSTPLEHWRALILGLVWGVGTEMRSARPTAHPLTPVAMTTALLCTLPGFREPTSATARPRRSARAAMLVVACASLFWGSVVISVLMRVPVQLNADGRPIEMSAARLLGCMRCVLWPRRLFRLISDFQEPLCVKEALQAALGIRFERLCVLPQHLNKCFDWDVSGTRWQREGLSVADAYKALGVSPRASMSDIKAAHRRNVLANHPDKVQFEPGSPRAESAALAFMKAQKAFETIQEARKAGPKPSMAAPPTPPPSRPSRPPRPRSSDGRGGAAHGSGRARPSGSRRKRSSGRAV